MLKNLYSVVKQSADEVTVSISTEAHPIFKAHFPDFPILPGFMQIDILAEIFSENIVHIKRSKFLSHILPEDVIVYQIKTMNDTKKITVFRNEKKISEIEYATA